MKNEKLVWQICTIFSFLPISVKKLFAKGQFLGVIAFSA
jgi:hypothetical protein